MAQASVAVLTLATPSDFVTEGKPLRQYPGTGPGSRRSRLFGVQGANARLMLSRIDIRTNRGSDMKSVRIASRAADLLPVRLTQEDRSQSFNTRLRASTIAAIEARAQADGATMKQVICRGLAAIGVAVAPADLEDGTPRRRAA